MWFWHSSKEEIENWIEVKEEEFAEKENKNPILFAEEWLQRYILTNLHENLFSTFPSELHAW